MPLAHAHTRARLSLHLGKLLAFGPKIAQMAGYTNRIYGLMEEMEKITKSAPGGPGL